MNRKKPSIRLPSSREVLYHPDDSLDEDTLLMLLEEGFERGVHPFKKVIITQKRRNHRLNEWGFEGAYIHEEQSVRYHQLLDEWKSLYAATLLKKFSPENEQDRNSIHLRVLANQAAFPIAFQMFMREMGRQYQPKKPRTKISDENAAAHLLLANPQPS